MNILILGLVVFIGVHLFPSSVKFRQHIINRTGEKTYKIVFAMLAAIGLILIIVGKGQASFATVWEPPAWGSRFALLVMPLSFISITAGYLPSNIKRFTAHPMLLGVIIWSIAHLLANGDRASMIIFATIGLYSLFDIVSANIRGAKKSDTKYSINKDLTVVLIGIASYVTILFLHPVLTGIRLIN